MMTKTFSIFRWLVLSALLIVSFAGFSQTFTYEGVKYTIKDATAKKVWIATQSTLSGTVVIPENVEYNGETYTVTGSNDNALNDCSELVSITFPSTIEALNNIWNMSNKCSKLKEITVLGGDIYGLCSNLSALEVLTIGENVTGLHQYLKSTGTRFTIGGKDKFVTIHYYPKHIETGECLKMPGNSFDNTVSRPFSLNTNNSLANIYIHEGVEYIGNYCFYIPAVPNKSIHRLYLPSTLTEIGEGAFYANIDTVYCSAATPPKITIKETENPDAATSPKCDVLSLSSFKKKSVFVLKVPCGSEEKYKTDPQWSQLDINMIIPYISEQIVDTVCEGATTYTDKYGNVHTITQDGQTFKYEHDIEQSEGEDKCKGEVVLTLYFGHPKETTIVKTLCAGEKYYEEGGIKYEAGKITKKGVYKTYYGCDSTVYYNVVEQAPVYEKSEKNVILYESNFSSNDGWENLASSPAKNKNQWYRGDPNKYGTNKLFITNGETSSSKYNTGVYYKEKPESRKVSAYKVVNISTANVTDSLDIDLSLIANGKDATDGGWLKVLVLPSSTSITDAMYNKEYSTNVVQYNNKYYINGYGTNAISVKQRIKNPLSSAGNIKIVLLWNNGTGKQNSEANAVINSVKLFSVGLEDQYLCKGESVDINGQQITTNGVYAWKTDSKTEDGCPIYKQVNVKILEIEEKEAETATICSGGSYVWDKDGKTYNSAGTYTYIESKSDNSGCIKYTLNLIVNPADNENLEVVFCEEAKDGSGDYHTTYNGQDVNLGSLSVGTTENVGPFNLKNTTNCYVNVKYKVIILPNEDKPINEIICYNDIPTEGYTYTDDYTAEGVTTTIDGEEKKTYTIPQSALQEAADTTYTKDLTITYTKGTTTCTRTVKLNINVGPAPTTVEGVVCYGEKFSKEIEFSDGHKETLEFTNVTSDLNDTKTWDNTITNGEDSKNCAYTVTYKITVHPKPENEERPATLCWNEEKYEASFNDKSGATRTVSYTWDASDANTVKDVPVSCTDENGCAYTVTYKITVHPKPENEVVAVICDGEDYAENNFNVTNGSANAITDADNGEGTYLTNQATVQTFDYTRVDKDDVTGCDVTTTLHLTVNPLPQQLADTTINKVVCKSEVVNGKYTLSFTDYGSQNRNKVIDGIELGKENKGEVDTYSYTLINTNNCEKTVERTVKYVILVAPDDTAVTEIMCAENLAAYTYKDSYDESANTDEFVATVKGLTAGKTHTGTKIYNVTVSDGENTITCPRTVTYSITVINTEDTTINLTFCDGDEQTYTYKDQLGNDHIATFNVEAGENDKEIVSDDNKITVYEIGTQKCERQIIYNVTVIKTENVVIDKAFCKDDEDKSITYIDQFGKSHTENFSNVNAGETKTLNKNYTLTKDGHECFVKVTYNVAVINAGDTTISQVFCEADENKKITYKQFDFEDTQDFSNVQPGKDTIVEVPYTIEYGEKNCDVNVSYKVSVIKADSIVNLTLCENESGEYTMEEYYGKTFTYTLEAGATTTKEESFTYGDNECPVKITYNVYVQKSDTTIVDTIKAGEHYTSFGFDATTTGEYDTEWTTDCGCIQNVHLDLTVISADTLKVDTVICQGITYEEYGFSLTESGLYDTNWVNEDGFLQNVSLKLYVQSSDTTVYDTICIGDTYLDYGFNQNATGVYTSNITTEFGCQQTVTLYLQVEGMDSTITEYLCYGDSYEYDGKTFGESGTYVLINTTTDRGCDSILTLKLTVDPQLIDTVEAETCNGVPFDWNGEQYTEEGEYIYNTNSVVTGCDSMVVLNLIVKEVFNDTIEAMICEGDTYTDFGFNENTTGIYTHEETSVNGCDSLFVLNLTVNPKKDTTITVDICDGDVYTINGHDYSATGSYTEILRTEFDCDSTVNFNLVVHLATNDTIFDTICSDEVYLFAGEEIDQSGVYVDSLQNAYGCDSLITLMLHVNPAYHDTLNVTIPEGSIYDREGFYASESGFYYHNYQTVDGCDSIITLNLEIDTPIDIWVPTGFQPTNDNNNEWYIIVDDERFRLNSLKVYYRWGGVVWTAKSISEHWDGKYKGKLCQEGVYVYELIYHKKGNKDKLYRKVGEFMLMH